MAEKLLHEIQEALRESEISSDGARRLNLLALSGLIAEVHDLREEMRKIAGGMDDRLKKVEGYVPWLKGLAWFVAAVGVAVIGAVVRGLFG